MRQHPAPIFRRPGLSDGPHRLVILVDDGFERAARVRPLQVAGAAQTGGRMPDINRDLLAPPRLHLPKVGNGHPDAGEYGGAGLPDLEPC